MKNEKIMDAVRMLRQMCAEQTDCVHCDFGRDNRTCKISGIPAQWFDDEDHPAGVGNMVKTRQERFLEMFPKGRLASDGMLEFCPQEVDSGFMCPMVVQQSCAVHCVDCRREYWLTAEKEDSHD